MIISLILKFFFGREYLKKQTKNNWSENVLKHKITKCEYRVGNIQHPWAVAYLRLHEVTKLSKVSRKLLSSFRNLLYQSCVIYHPFIWELLKQSKILRKKWGIYIKTKDNVIMREKIVTDVIYQKMVVQISFFIITLIVLSNHS